MSIFSNFFSKKQSKSNNVLQQNSNINYNSNNYNSSLLSDNIENTWKNNPYLYYKNSLAIIINQISSFISILTYQLEDNKGNIITSNNFQEIIDLLQKPSSRQQTTQQLIYDLSKEYIFNKIMFVMFDMNNNTLTALKSSELQADGYYTNDKIIKTYRLFIANGIMEVFTLNEDGYYINQNNTLMLFTSELVFEELGLRVNISYNTPIIYSKNILNEIWNFVYLEFTILNKNISLCQVKQEANLLAVSLQSNARADDEARNKLLDSIKNATTNAYNNGTTQAFFSELPLDAKLIPLNNNSFTMQFEELLNYSKRNLYNYFQIPPEIAIEQAKYSNNVTANLSFIENCIQPRADFIYNFLSTIIQKIYQVNIKIAPDYNATSIKKQYNLDNTMKIANVLTANEIRIEAGFDEKNEFEVSYLSLNKVQSVPVNNDNSIKEVKSFFNENNFINSK